VFYFVTGSPYRLPAAALNGFLGALTVVFVYRLARSLFSERVAAWVGWWTCLFPSMIIWSAQTVKEPVVILLETLALYGCTQFRQSGFQLRHVLLTSAAIVLVYPFRFYAAYVAVGTVAASLLLARVRRRHGEMGTTGAALMIVVFLLASLFMGKES